MANMGSKLNVFKDPYLDRATETSDLLAKMKSLNANTTGDSLGSGFDGLSGGKAVLENMLKLNDDLKAKADRLNDLTKMRDDLDARRQKRQGINELRTGLQQACA
mmetsp:Transcript_10009/g.12582  ORF Transcript_10009/g.12582 Transcript_10009/m.12582 type:complete len:105 (+) Transcript_10009:2680-2994(+)